jgi:hypothetical protein
LVVWVWLFFSFLSYRQFQSCRYRLRQSHRQCVILRVVVFFCFFFTCMFSRSAAEWHTNGQFGTGRPLTGWMLREWSFFLLFPSCPTKSSIMVHIYIYGWDFGECTTGQELFELRVNNYRYTICCVIVAAHE